MTIGWEYILFRLGAALLAGAAVGLNRDLHSKPIGMRTLALVALGAATVTVAAIQFDRLSEDANALARVVQGVLQGVLVGIGFIGAGVIVRNEAGNKVHGLTTAATVFISAALGIACGLAAWRVAVVGVALAMAALVVLGRLDKLIDAKHD